MQANLHEDSVLLTGPPIAELTAAGTAATAATTTTTSTTGQAA